MPKAKPMWSLRYLTVLLVLVQSTNGNAALNVGKSITLSIDINHPDSSIHTSVLVSNSRIKPRQSSTYFWYGNGAIHSTDGGFSGRLLQGQYSVYFPNRNLKTQGSFDHGLKHGKWITWYSSGRIHTINHFSHGQLTGVCEEFDPNNKLVRRVNYKNGVRHGKATLCSHDGRDSVVSYKRGSLIVKKKNVETKKSRQPKSETKSDSLRHKQKTVKEDTIGVNHGTKKKSNEKVIAPKKKPMVSKKRKTLRDLFRLRKRSTEIEKQN